jgi:hypothetical protein
LKELTIESQSVDKIMENVIKKLKENHAVEPVYYEFFSQLVHFSHDSTLHFLEEHYGKIYQNNRHQTKINLQKSRIKSVSKIGEQILTDYRLINMYEMYTDNLLKYQEDFLKRRHLDSYNYQYLDYQTINGRGVHQIGFHTDKNTYYAEIKKL